MGRRVSGERPTERGQRESAAGAEKNKVAYGAPSLGAKGGWEGKIGVGRTGAPIVDLPVNAC